MTTAPVSAAPAATSPAPVSPAGAGTAGDFMAMLMSALTTPTQTPPVEPVETTTKTKPTTAQTQPPPVEPVETTTKTKPTTAQTQPPPVEPVETTTKTKPTAADHHDPADNDDEPTEVDGPAPTPVGAALVAALPVTDVKVSTSSTSGGDDPVPASATSGAVAPAPAYQPALPATPQVVAPAAPSVAATTTAASPSVQLDHVTSQVFGEVTGLVSRGSGTHRIALTLHPEQLGEVRVVMTMRAGEVHVRLAAGHEARTSLVEGSPELTRMLEHAGATEARVVVRDLPAVAAAAPPTTGTPDSPLGSSTDRSPDQHAGTRADHPARDGAEHPRGHRDAVPPVVRPTQQVTGVRSAGVDLTM